MKQGKIESPNSPFEQRRFSFTMAQLWCRRQKADIVDGQLIFRDSFRLSIHRQIEEEERDQAERVGFERMVDIERGGRTVGVWKGRPTGPRAVGGPQCRALQMKTFRDRSQLG